MNTLKQAAVPAEAGLPAYLNTALRTSFDPGSGFGKLLLDCADGLFGRPLRPKLEVLLQALYDGRPEEMPDFSAEELRAAGPAAAMLFRTLDPAGLHLYYADFLLRLDRAAEPIPDAVVADRLREAVLRSNGTVRALRPGNTVSRTAAADLFGAEAVMTDGSLRKVLVLMRRPGAHETAERELALLKAALPEQGPQRCTFAGPETAIRHCTDLRLAAEDLRNAAVYGDAPEGAPEAADGKTDPSDGEPAVLQTARLFEAIPPTEDTVVLERPKGRLLASVLTDALDLLARVDDRTEPLCWDDALEMHRTVRDLQDLDDRVHTLARRWLREAALGDGFCHADIRAMTLFAALPPPGSEFGDAAGPGPLTLVGCGPALVLTETERRAVRKMLIGAAFRRPALMAAGYAGAVSDTEAADRAARLFETLPDGGTLNDGPLRLTAVLMRLRSENLPVPAAVAAFAVGITRFWQLSDWLSRLARTLHTRLARRCRRDEKALLGTLRIPADFLTGAGISERTAADEGQDYVRSLLAETVYRPLPPSRPFAELFGELLGGTARR